MLQGMSAKSVASLPVLLLVDTLTDRRNALFSMKWGGLLCSDQGLGMTSHSKCCCRGWSWQLGHDEAIGNGERNGGGGRSDVQSGRGVGRRRGDRRSYRSSDRRSDRSSNWSRLSGSVGLLTLRELLAKHRHHVGHLSEELGGIRLLGHIEWGIDYTVRMD